MDLEDSYAIIVVGKGRPAVVIPREQLAFLIDEGFSASKISKLLCCSKTVVYRNCYKEGIRFRDKYSNLRENSSGIKLRHSPQHILIVEVCFVLYNFNSKSNKLIK